MLLWIWLIKSVACEFEQNPAIADIYTEHSVQTTVAKYSPSGFYIASAGLFYCLYFFLNTHSVCLCTLLAHWFALIAFFTVQLVPFVEEIQFCWRIYACLCGDICDMHWYRILFHFFYIAAALFAMRSAVLATAIPSIRLSVLLSHAGTLSRRMKIGSRGLHCEVAKTL